MDRIEFSRPAAAQSLMSPSPVLSPISSCQKLRRVVLCFFKACDDFYLALNQEARIFETPKRR